MSDTAGDKAVKRYGEGDTSFQAAGGEAGIRRLADAFYDTMAELPQAKTIHEMHGDNIDILRDKLARFLCGWLGGPKLFREKYGPIQIPKAHSHLDIGLEERDAWLACMERALAQQPYQQDFRDYMLKELFRPADRSRTKD
ncbi:group II truncated hemoglobin [Oceanicoccus sagamiensis]|uniref:Globin n=1 Tax=Oceanicoccus sagamiensis TaxID=716816 RepID=A0A1X9NGG0_9GAMM|nr:group II truncated hemoglobin [Oceanicoccus sagamiensis]ARN74935.1 globin [Oceanicoccus sagamiensis]